MKKTGIIKQFVDLLVSDPTYSLNNERRFESSVDEENWEVVYESKIDDGYVVLNLLLKRLDVDIKMDMEGIIDYPSNALYKQFEIGMDSESVSICQTKNFDPDSPIFTGINGIFGDLTVFFENKDKEYYAFCLCAGIDVNCCSEEDMWKRIKDGLNISENNSLEEEKGNDGNWKIEEVENMMVGRK